MKTETSKTSPIQICKVVPDSGTGGFVAITLAPGKHTLGYECYWKRDLDDDLDRLRSLGTTVLVPFLEDDELARLEIPSLVGEAETKGIKVVRFPFHDGGVPKDMNAALNLAG